MPYEWGDSVEGAGRRGESAQRRAESAGPVDVLLRPEPAQQGVVLDRERDALADVLTEPGVDGAGVPASHHEVDATVRHVLEHGVVLGDLHRVVRRDERRRSRQDEGFCRAGDAGEGRRGRGGEEGRVVVLSEGEDVEAGLFGVLRHDEDVGDALGFGGGASGRRVGGEVGDAHDSELHRGSFVGVDTRIVQVSTNWGRGGVILLTRARSVGGEPDRGRGNSPIRFIRIITFFGGIPLAILLVE